MSEVRVTGSLACISLRKTRADRSGADSATLHANYILNELTSSRIGYACVQFDSGSETMRGAAVAVSRPSADIFEEALTKASAEFRNISRIDVPRFSASADPRTADQFAGDLNLRNTNRIERGHRTCQ
jgi:hypothetical protein